MWRTGIPIRALALLQLASLVPCAWGQEEDFKLEAEGATYHVVVGVPAPAATSPPAQAASPARGDPASGTGKIPLVIYHHGAGRRGLEKFELRRLAARFAAAGYLFWAPERGAANLPVALAVADAALAKGVADARVDPARIAVVGFSQGSVAAFLHGTRSARVRAICLCGFGGGGADERMREQILATEFGKVAARVLILVGAADREAPPEGSEGIERELRAAGKPVKRVVYPGLRHDDLCGDKKYLEEMLAWLEENL